MTSINSSLPAVVPESNITSPITPSAPVVLESSDSFESSSEDSSTAVASPKLTPLQKHLQFFDLDGDGSISVSENIEAFRQLGRSGLKQYILLPILNFIFGTLTRGYPSFSLDISNIKAGKHEGSSDIFDAEGNIDDSKFDALFSQYDINNDGALDKSEIESFIARNAKTFFGRLAVKFEFPILLEVAGEDQEVNGTTEKVLTKARPRRFYNGDLFYEIAERRIPSE